MAKRVVVPKVSKRIPRYKLPIHGRAWTIYMVTHEQMALYHPDLNGAPMRGLADDDTSSVFLNSEFPIDTVITTCFHELTHAWLTNLAGAKGENDDLIPEEACANLVSTGIVELLTHHELLIAWMTKHVPEESERE
jgi:hypothetical protein